MIKELAISRFKSIKSLVLPCNKVNLFIGAPDTGKTNILEALHFLSRLGWFLPIDRSFRIRSESGLATLFHRQFYDKPIEIRADQSLVSAKPHGQQRGLLVQYNLKTSNSSVSGEQELNFGESLDLRPHLSRIRFYAYGNSMDWEYRSDKYQADSVVTPPDGMNLMYIARHNEGVNSLLKDTVATIGWKLHVPLANGRLTLAELRQDEILDYNIDLLSDSLKRFFFYSAILLTSSDATLVFDEPDVQAFPPYPKLLAEKIAADKTNQFFLTTHNPYFLSGIVEKTPADQLSLFVCYRDPDGSTAARLLDTSEVQLVMEQGASVFFNLQDFVPSQ